VKGSRQAGSLAVAVAATGLALACSPPPSQRPPSEAAPAPGLSPAAEPSPPARLQPLPPPGPQDVKAVVERIFKGAAGADGQAVFTVGDFNGDLSQDIAIVVRPMADRLAEMNASPRWMLKDARVIDAPGAAPLRVEADETLVAVVHGEGPDGWRNPQATQTWLLKNAAGSAMETRAARDFLLASHGRAVPRIHGDLIAAVVGGVPGCLYYTGASYAWYDPRTFVSTPPPRFAHRNQPR
jgi:hypothetical protein